MAGRVADWRRAGGTLLALSVMLLLAGCAGSPRSAPPSAPGGRGSSAAASPSASASRAGAGAQNLVASSSVKAALLAAYAAEKGLPQSEVIGPLPGTLYYGVIGTAGTYWAVAHFRLTPSAPPQALVGMQDGGDIGVFSRHAGQAWAVRLGDWPFPCPGALPAALMAVWGITSPGSCGVLSASSPAKAQATAATALDMPAGTYFGAVLDVELQLDGYGYIDFEPETWQGTSSPASKYHTYYNLAIGRSTAAGYWTGTSRSASHEVLGRFDLAFGQRVKSAMVPFMTQPLSGYEVTVTVPAGCSGACSAVARIIQLNSVAPLPVQPNFTEPSPAP